MTEKWVTITYGKAKGFQVSDIGNIKNQSGEIVRQYNHAEGYKRFRLKGDWYYVHRAVLEGFFPTSDNTLVADHIDNDRTNNHVDNLRWVTRRQNTARAGRAGRLSVYEKTRPIIMVNKQGNAKWYVSQAEASRDLNIPDCSINKALKGHRKTVHGYIAIYA